MCDLELADIKASQKGDHEAYRRLVERHEASVSRLMWRFSQEVNVCEELTHETFVEAYTSLARFQFQGPFSAWLKTIATRTGYRYWTKQRREQKYVHLDKLESLAIAKSHPKPFEAEVLANYLLSRLKPTERLVLTLLYLDSCSIKEISKRLGWTEGIVKMRAYRARRKLKTIVEREKLLDTVEFEVARYQPQPKLQQINRLSKKAVQTL